MNIIHEFTPWTIACLTAYTCCLHGRDRGTMILSASLVWARGSKTAGLLLALGALCPACGGEPPGAPAEEDFVSTESSAIERSREIPDSARFFTPSMSTTSGTLPLVFTHGHGHGHGTRNTGTKHGPWWRPTSAWWTVDRGPWTVDRDRDRDRDRRHRSVRGYLGRPNRRVFSGPQP